MAGSTVDYSAPRNAAGPLFSREVDGGAVFAGIVAAIIVVGMVACSVFTTPEVQPARENPLPQTLGR